ncbi:SDR family NAD(P)-dependent oxidoreductase [Pedobacter panaciterrae]|uniref:SDR family NAD(P)-dependent oxidoreductase n=1 Tax=Pedobacter panaciterrae TaxID=363849 RepID=UPI0025930B6F|nr:SDR family oxidoreductase [uncultured Pedobacter sp.]
MLLKDKNAIIYGAGGSLGGAVASALASAGAHVFLTGHNIDSVKNAASKIESAGGKASIHQVDARDEKSVNNHIQAVMHAAGSVDISFNAIGWQDTQDIPLTEMALADFLRPINIAMETQFITATAAARVMMPSKSGVILSLTATPGGIGYANVGGFGPACNAVEAFSRNLAAELGPYGIRVVNIRSAGSPDSRIFKEAIEAGGEKVQEFLKKMEDDTMLKQLPLMEDIANTAVFLASNMAGKITGVTIDVTAGTTSALNYKVTNIAFL